MKIIRCDSFDRDTVDDAIVVEGLTNRREAEAMLKGLEQMAMADPHSQDWYRLVEDNYVLKRWEP